MKILKPNEIGKGILIEYDAGHISMKNSVDTDLVNEQKSQLDHSKPFVFYATLQKYVKKTTLKREQIKKAIYKQQIAQSNFD